jgi:hypothetical protein
VPILVQRIDGQPVQNRSQVILKRATGHGAGKAELGWLAGQLPGEPVVLFTQTANARSMRLAAKLGFTGAGRFEAYGAEQWFGMASPPRRRDEALRTRAARRLGGRQGGFVAIRSGGVNATHVQIPSRQTT